MEENKENKEIQTQDESSSSSSSSTIEKRKKPTKKDRSPAQIEAFKKARQNRANNIKKRELEKLERYNKLKSEVGKEKEVVSQPEIEKKKSKKKIVVHEEETSSSDSDSSIEIVVKRKKKEKQVVEKEEEHGYDTPPDRKQMRNKHVNIDNVISWL